MSAAAQVRAANRKTRSTPTSEIFRVVAHAPLGGGSTFATSGSGLWYHSPDPEVAKVLPPPSGACATTLNISDVGVLRVFLFAARTCAAADIKLQFQPTEKVDDFALS